MEISGARVSSVANIRDHLALFCKLAFCNAVGVTLQMSVVKDQFPIDAQLVDGRAAAFALEEFDDLAIGGGHDWSSRGRGNIDSVMHTAF